MKPAAPVTTMRTDCSDLSPSDLAKGACASSTDALKRAFTLVASRAFAVEEPCPILSKPGPANNPPTAAGWRPKLLFLVTEDWYFCSHRLAVARAARVAGFDIVVATRVGSHGEAIEGEGFRLCPLGWRRRGGGPWGALRALAAIALLYRAERPDIVHHVALKPVLFGGLARRLAFPGRKRGPAVVAAVMGLGSGFSRAGASAWLRRRLLAAALVLVAGGRGVRVVAQNPEDGAALRGFGIAAQRIVLIRGSGVDTRHFRPRPEAGGDIVRAALVARMLRQKGVAEAAVAVRSLRARGVAIELLLAGPTDPDNKGSLDAAALAALAAEPGVTWLGPVADVREVWRRAAIAVLPSSYGEGLPKALLEAAACARPIVATDIPGCREIVRTGETGILVPPGDPVALEGAILALARDGELRRRLGWAGRALAEREFAEEIVARETLGVYRALLDEIGLRR
jgi:glycosyltransferase involved in cell wall biosynthesis